MAINTSDQAIDESFDVGVEVIDLVVPEGPFLKVTGTGVTLTILDQTIGGTFSITRQTDAVTGASLLTIAITDGFLTLGGTPALVDVSAVNGAFIVTDSGLAAVLEATVALSLPSANLSGSFALEINTTTEAVDQTIDTVVVDLPAGPYLRLSVTGLDVSIAGQTLTGDFAVQEQTQSDGSTKTSVAVANASINLGDGAVVVTNGTGFFLITAAGLAGSLAATVAIDPALGVTFTGTFGIEINTTSASVDETIQVGLGTNSLNLPAGPFLRVSGTDVRLNVAGQSLSGDFSIERVTLASGATVTKIAASNVGLAISDGTTDLLTLTNGFGTILILPADTDNSLPGGVAASFGGTVALGVPGASLTGTLQVEINQMLGRPVTETFSVGGTDVVMDLPAGKFLRVRGTGVALTLGGIELSGNFSFTQATNAGESFLEVSFDSVEVGIGDGDTDFVRITNGAGTIVAKGGDLYGSFEGSVIVDIPSVELSVAGASPADPGFEISINTSGIAQTVGGEVIDPGFRIEANNPTLKIAGIEIGATKVAIAQTSVGDVSELTIEITDLSIDLAGYVTATVASANIIVTDQGIGANVQGIAVSAVLPGVASISATGSLRINTSATPFTSLDLPGGPFVEVAVLGATLTVAGQTLTADIYFQQTTRLDGSLVTFFAVDNLSASIGTFGIANGSGSFLVLPDGVAGIVSGDATAGFPGIDASATISLTFNATGLVLNQTVEVAGTEFVFDIPATGGVCGDTTFYCEMAVQNAELIIADFIYIEVQGLGGAGAGIKIEGGSIFIGNGPGLIDEDDSDTTPKTVNPDAVGVLLSDVYGYYEIIDKAQDHFFVYATGTVQVLGIDGVAITATATVKVHTGGQLAGTVAGIKITPTAEADFSNAAGGGITIGNRTDGVADETIAEGSLKADLSARLEIDVDGTPGIDPAQDFILDGDITVEKPLVGPGITLVASGSISVLGQSIGGTFFFQQVTLPQAPNAIGDPPTALRVGIQDGFIEIAGVVSVTEINGFFLITDAGLAGEIGVTVDLNIPGVSESDFMIDGSFKLVINTTGVAVAEQFEFQGTTASLSIVAGPFLRVEANNISIRILGQRLQGDFAFEKTTDAGGADVVAFGMNNVSIGLGDGTTDVVSISSGQGVFLINAAGFAGRLSGNVSFAIPNVELAGAVSLAINTGAAAVDTTFEVDGVPLPLKVEAGGTSGFVRVEVTGIGDDPETEVLEDRASLTIAGQVLSGAFVFEQKTLATGERLVVVGLRQVELNIGNGVVVATINEGIFVITPTGIGASIAATLVVNTDPFKLGVPSPLPVLLLINTSPERIVETVDVGGADITIDVPGGPYVKVQLGTPDTPAAISILDISLSGVFVFEQSTTSSGASVVRLGMSHVSLDLGPVEVRNGEGIFVLFPDVAAQDILDDQNVVVGQIPGSTGGLAGRISADVNIDVPGVAIGGNFGVSINNLDREVNESLSISDTESIDLTLPAGPYFKVEAIGATIAIGSVVLGADVSFEKDDSSDEIVIAANKVSLDLGSDIVRVTDGSGVLIITPASPGVAGGLTGQFEVTVELNIPEVTFEGTFGLKINQLPDPFPARNITLGTETLTVDVPFGNYLAVELTAPADGTDVDGDLDDDVLLTIAGQTLYADRLAFSQTTNNGADGIAGTADDETIVRVEGEDVGLNLGPADEPILTLGDGNLLLEINNEGLAGVVEIGAFEFDLDPVNASLATDGSIEVQINNRASAFEVDADTTLPAGPFVRVEVLGLTLDILGVAMKANFVFEQQTRGTGATAETVTKVAASGLEFDLLGDDTTFLLTEGSGALFIDSQGLAATISGTVNVNAGPFVFGGTFGVAINNRATAVNETIVLGDDVFALDMVAGPFLRVDATQLEIEMFGQSLKGNFSFERVVTAPKAPATVGETVIKVAASQVELRIGDGTTDFVIVTEGSGNFLILPAGAAGQFQATVDLNVPNVDFGGTFGVRFNTTGQLIDETFDIIEIVGGDPITTSQDLDVPASLEFEVFGEGVTLGIAGQTLSGNFSFSKSTTVGAPGSAPISVVKVAASDVRLGLGDGTTDYITVYDGEGAFILSSGFPNPGGTPVSGMVGQLSAKIDTNIDGFELNGKVAVQFSNVNVSVRDTVEVPGIDPIVIDFAAGPFLSVVLTGVDDPAIAGLENDADGDGDSDVILEIAGQTLFATQVRFEQQTAASGAKIISLVVEDLGLIITSGDEELFQVVIDEGVLLVTPQGVAGRLTAQNPFGADILDTVNLNVTSIELQINNLGVAVNETFEGLNGPLALKVPAGPFVRLEMVGATLAVDVDGTEVALVGSFAFEQATYESAGPTVTTEKITRIGVAGAGVTIDGQQLVSVSGALILVPVGYDSDGTGAATPTTTGGIAGELQAKIGAGASGAAGDVEVGAFVSLKVNTTGATVKESITVGSELLEVDLGPIDGGFEVGVGVELALNIGDFVTIEGAVSFSGGAFVGEDILVFMGAGPYRNDDGTENEDAIGLVLRADQIRVERYGSGASTTYAVYATGAVDVIGVDGLVIQATAILEYNSSSQTQTLDGHVINAGVTSFAATNLVIDLAGWFAVKAAAVRFSRQPNGTVDVQLAGGEIAVNITGGGFDPADNQGANIISVKGAAVFSLGGAEGFRLQSFRVNGFSIFDPANGAAADPNQTPVFFPTADLGRPTSGSTTLLSAFNAQGDLLVKFNDPNNVGILDSSITDGTPEFDVFINGQPAGLTFGAPVKDAILPGVWRYPFSGAIASVGELSVVFRSSAFQDNQGNANISESEYISLVNLNASGELPSPAPVGKLASPVNGSVISASELSGRLYIDVTFISRDGSPINASTIDGNEFKLVGPALNRVKTVPGSGGIPDFAGQPLQVGADTWRYFLKLDKSGSHTGNDLVDNDGDTKIDEGDELPLLFKAGSLEVQFIAGSFSTMGDSAAGNTAASSVARTERITVQADPVGQQASSGAINLGPLTLQGPSIGIADFGFKDGLVMLTIAIGVERASLAFGSSGGGDGPSADLIGIVGTFDIGVDVFGLLSGNVRVEVPGKWSLSVSSLEVTVPDVLEITAEGIRIQYDPSADNTQEIVTIDEANIFIPAFSIRGTIRTFDPDPNVVGDELPGLVVRGNGFTLGEAELCYGCEGIDPSQALTNTGAETNIKFGNILELDDIRLGVNQFDVTFGSSFEFNGEIYLASGGAALFPGNSTFTMRIEDRDSAQDVRSDGSIDDEAFRIAVAFEGNEFEGFKLDVDTLNIEIAGVVTITAVDFMLDTSAEGTEELISFVSVGATVKIGSLVIGGEARNFAILGNGDFDAKPGFGVFLSVGSASGDSFKWPSWLPIKINALGIEWPDFDNDPGDFLISLSASVSGLPAVAGLNFEGTIEGVKISPQKLIEGKFPIVDIAAIGVRVTGKVFGGELTATLLGGILKVDGQGNAIDVFDSTTPVADRILFFGVEGGFSLPAIGGLTIRFGLSELGPLGVLINVQVPGGVPIGPPQIGLMMNDFVAGVEFFKSLPSITDPLDLRNPEFSASGNLSVDGWLTQLRGQVAAQYRAIQANPALGGFLAAFTAPMTFTGGAKIYSLYTSQAVFNGEVQIKISTDGKFLIIGKLNFADGALSLSAKLYADLSNIAEGDATVLFLADIPDQFRLLTIHGKFSMGFRNAGGDIIEFDVADETDASPVATTPTAALIDPAAGMVDVGQLNHSTHQFNGKNYIDVEFSTQGGAVLDYESILDSDAEFTLMVDGQAVAVDGAPIPLVTMTDASGMVTTAELVPNAGETMAEAIIRDGTSRFRYLISENGYQFPLGEAELMFISGSFKNVDVTLDSGVVPGETNESATVGFTIEGATATLLDPGADGGIDITSINQRGFIDVRFAPSAGATLDAGSITDASEEFTLGGSAAANVVLDGGPTLVAGTTDTFRYTFTGEFTRGVVTVDFIEGRWMDSTNENRAFTQTFRIEGATGDIIVPSSGGSIGRDEINQLGYIQVRYNGTAGAPLNHDTIDGDEIILRDAEGLEVTLQDPQRIENTNLYRYAFDTDLAVGRYDVEFVVGSFEDVASTPNLNLVEIESFYVEVPVATIVDPMPFDTIDREALNAQDYIDVKFTPVSGAALDHDSILDADPEFTLSGAEGQNIVIAPGATLVEGTTDTFRYDLSGSFDTGQLNVTFIPGSWSDEGTLGEGDVDAGVVLHGNSGGETTDSVIIITQASSFFIELSGGIILESAGIFDEPLFEVKAEATIEIDSVRKVFSLSFNGELSIIKLGTVGATAGKFVLDNSGELSNAPQFWGVMTLETNFSALEPLGIFMFGKGTLQINLTTFEKTEDLTLRGLGDNGEDITRTFVLPPLSFSIEVVGQLRVRPPGTSTDLMRLQGGFVLRIDPSRFEIFATAELSFGVGSAQLTYGEASGLIIVKTGLPDADGNPTGIPGIAGMISVSSSAGIGIPGVGGLFEVSGSVNVMFNTTLEDQTFDIPESFYPLLDPGDPTTLEIFASRPGLDGQRDANGDPRGEVYVVATIQAELSILDSFILAGYVQIAVAVGGSGAEFDLTGAVTGELGPLGAVSGTLNLTIFVGEKLGVVGRIQLALDVGLGSLLLNRGGSRT